MEYRRNIRKIDLGILAENVRTIRAAVPSAARLLAVVKADAYGHGMVQVARTALASGAEWLAVALTEEGAALRHTGITAPILVLGATTRDSAVQGVQEGLTLTVCSPDMVNWIQQACEKADRQGSVHLKIDSGMSRIGCRNSDEVRAVTEALAKADRVHLTGAFTHFADADREDGDLSFTLQQYEKFRSLTDGLPEGIIRHCANSAAIHRLPQAAMDMVRAGITMYGYPPVATNMSVRPFMTWETEVTYVKDIVPGDTVSYGRTYAADKVRRVATVACGYGDGYHRAASGKAMVIIRGHKVPVIGRICMDQMMADVTDIPGVVPGDRVILMGNGGDESITAEDIASWAGTISYEVLLAATGRVPREWLNERE